MQNILRVALCAVLLPLAAMGQEDKAVLTGIVSDPSRASIPDATIAVVNASNGFLRRVDTNKAGSFYIADLPIGTYHVTISKTGFRASQIDAVQLLVGQVRTLNAQLQIGANTQEIRVEASTTPLTESTAAVGGVILPQQIANLPINGRNWTALLALVPGAVDSGGGNQQSVRFAGRGNDDNNFRFDGVDATGVQHQSQVTTVRLQISTEAIAEFRVDSILYTAEQGGAPGGQAEVISKSGSNNFHGSAFEYFRNDKLDSRTPFDPSTLPELRLNQFGASLGGAIVKDKTFFFMDYEGLRQRQGQTLIGFVPSDSLRARTLAASPGLAPILSAYPRGTSPSSADVSQWSAVARSTGDEDSGLIRLDHRFSEALTVFARYNIDKALLTSPSGTLLDVSQTPTAPMNGTIQFVQIFSPTLVNQTQFGVNRIAASSITESHLYDVSHLSESVSVPGFSTLAQNRTAISNPTSYSALDHLNSTVGQHTIKAGLEVRRVLFNQNNAPSQGLSYASLNAFVSNQLDTVTVASGIPMHGMDKTNYFGYVQDQWKAQPNLTLNLGLRYENYGVLREVYGRARPFDPQTCGGYCPLGSPFWLPVNDDVEPRVSFAWSPKAFNGKTVLRSGWGIYKGEGQISDLTNANENLQQRFTLTSRDFPTLAFPAESLFPLAIAQDTTPRAQQRSRQDPTVQQWGLQIETELGKGFVLDTGYVGSHGYHQFTRTFINVINPQTGLRPFSGFGIIDSKDANNNSSFNGWQTSLQRHFRAGWLLQANYLFSHSINDGSVGGGEADYPQNVACRTCERASSDQDVRHSFTMSSVWELPFGKGRRFSPNGKFAEVFAGGWQLSVIGTARSGLPVNITAARSVSSVPDGNNFSPQRPDLVPGESLSPANRTIDTWINPAAFVSPADGTFGNAGRNLVRGPGLWQADVGLNKSFPVIERLTLSFRAEAFNIFNRAQFGNPSGNLSSSDFGRITTTVNDGATGSGTPRQFQLALRLDF